jgi:hypothetical protein
MGTINIETDSVRKYTPDQYKHGQNSKAKLHGTKTSKKLEAKCRLPRIDESQDESRRPLTERQGGRNQMTPRSWPTKLFSTKGRK